MNGDLLRTEVLEDDDGPARSVAVGGGLFVAERGTGRGQHGDRQLPPVGHRVLALGVVHLLQVVVVALSQSSNRSLQRRPGE